MMAAVADKLESSVHGKGLFAKVDIPLGTILYHPCPSCIDEKKLTSANGVLERSKLLEYYGFCLEDGSLFVSCGDTRYMNHSCNATLLDYGLDFCISVRPIAAGEEITQDYRTFISDSIGSWRIECRCGAPRCARIVEPLAKIDPDLRRMWDIQLRIALRQVLKVYQPLHDTLKHLSLSYIRLLEATSPEQILDDAISIRRPLHLFPHKG